ncbi:MAG TPA: tRNA (adenosine(37)-N6)-threonylcarbamoyltransferase complex dimerization subunit type 1 TsaB [Candidatus Saccharimonadales bacterium]|jgi:tRNA threonylcarbamoyladenosine biosynthesis protein TsaB|nr:tRNA (adenosine(37)-N6)-threonylcarbamoyltransferase complex dimerization subunit type 1 TsaB [Candidatus Saccharimonadales bacterium]
MLILAVDTSTRTGSAAILRDSQILAEVSGYEETLYSNRLFRDIAALQEKANFSMDQVDVFAVSSGPGSFTGLRVGLTAVKAWAEVHGKPIAAISGLEAIAYESLASGVPEAFSASFIAPFMDARRGQIFGAVYRNARGNELCLELVTDESILSLDEFLDMAKGKSAQPVALISPTPDVLPSARIEEAFPGQRVIPVSAALAPAIGRLGFERARRGELVDAIRLDANYVRRSDAEAAWKDG